MSKGSSVSLGIAGFISVAMAVAFAGSMMASDYIFASRLLPWVPTLNLLQMPGVTSAAIVLPCKGWGEGCEYYEANWFFVVTVVTNAVVYLPFVFAAVNVYCSPGARQRRARRAQRRAANRDV